MAEENTKLPTGKAKGGSRTFCSAVNCSNSKLSNPELSFFRFPSDPKRYVKTSIEIFKPNCEYCTSFGSFIFIAVQSLN